MARLRPTASTAPWRSCRGRSASIPTTRSRASTTRSSTDRSSRCRNGPRVICRSARRAKTRSRAGRAARAGRTAQRRRSASTVLSASSALDTKPRKDVVTKRIRDRQPRLAQNACSRSNDRVFALLERRCAVIIRTRTGALLTLASEVIARYRAEKESRGLLDYDDLIAKTRDLLTRVSAAWVHYKLDLGIDHLLIDEAQDTSPEQWDIIARLVAEFAAGTGARGALRRIDLRRRRRQAVDLLVPGRGAARVRRHARAIQADASRPPQIEWRDVRLEHSFRSNDSVLTAVEHVFRAGRSSAASPRTTAGIPPHKASARRRAGLRRDLGAGKAGREAGGRALGCTVRQDHGDEPARQARAEDRQGGAHLDRSQGTRRHRRRAPCRAAGRHPRAGAPARAAVRGDHPRAQERERRGRRRRSVDPDRPYRGDGPAWRSPTRCCCRRTIWRLRACSRARCSA